MGHHTCCNKQKVKRGLWSPEEDEKLINYISAHGQGCWSTVPRLAGLQRCGKSCRLRWINYLRPDLKRGSFSLYEATLIIELHRVLGNRWTQIAKHLPGRTDNEVKNFWNSSIKKKLVSAHHSHPVYLTDTLFSSSFPNHSGGSSSDDLYLLNPNNNLVPNPQMDQTSIPNPHTGIQGFDPSESRFDELMNFHANLVSIPPPSDLPFSTPKCFSQSQEYFKQNENFLFAFDSPNPLLIGNNRVMNSKPEAQPYDQDSPRSDPSIAPTLNSTGKGIELLEPDSSAPQEPLLGEIVGLTGFSSAIEAPKPTPAPPTPVDYVESLVAPFAGSSPTLSSTSPRPASAGSFSPLPCNSPYLVNPSLAPAWGGPHYP